MAGNVKKETYEAIFSITKEMFNVKKTTVDANAPTSFLRDVNKFPKEICKRNKDAEEKDNSYSGFDVDEKAVYVLYKLLKTIYKHYATITSKHKNAAKNIFAEYWEVNGNKVTFKTKSIPDDIKKQFEKCQETYLKACDGVSDWIRDLNKRMNLDKQTKKGKVTAAWKASPKILGLKAIEGFGNDSVLFKENEETVKKLRSDLKKFKSAFNLSVLQTSMRDILNSIAGTIENGGEAVTEENDDKLIEEQLKNYERKLDNCMTVIVEGEKRQWVSLTVPLKDQMRVSSKSSEVGKPVYKSKLKPESSDYKSLVKKLGSMGPLNGLGDDTRATWLADLARFNGLRPLTLVEKLKLTLDGARAGDKGPLEYQYAWWFGENWKVCLERGGFDECLKHLTENVGNEADKQGVSELAYIEIYMDNIIWDGIKAGQTRKDSDHGVNHARRVVESVPHILTVARQYKRELELELEARTQRLARFACLFHDAGRRNHYIDIFDETSAHIAEKSMKKAGFNDKDIEEVKNAVANKDAPVTGKSEIAIILHEADCLDVYRVRDKFDIKYMDLFALYKSKKNITDDAVVYESDLGQSLKNLAKICGARIVDEGDKKGSYKPDVGWQRDKDAEAKKKLEEEAKKKLEEEAKKKLEEEAKKKLEEEALGASPYPSVSDARSFWRAQEQSRFAAGSAASSAYPYANQQAGVFGAEPLPVRSDVTQTPDTATAWYGQDLSTPSPDVPQESYGTGYPSGQTPTIEELRDSFPEASIPDGADPEKVWSDLSDDDDGRWMEYYQK